MTPELKRFLKRYVSGRVLRFLMYLRHPRFVRGPLTYNRDGLATQHSSDFLQDDHFREAYRLGKEASGYDSDLQWRAYIACWAAAKGRRLEGDFVECGVNRGLLARTIIHYVDFERLPKTFYLLDTFHGLVPEQVTDEERKRGVDTHYYGDCYEQVEETFGRFINVVLVKGAVPATLTQVPSEKVSYLSIDMNCAAPEIAAADFFWGKLVSGAVMVLDDYGWPNRDVQKKEFNKFAEERGVQILALPTGQGLIFKP
ncbi:MAG: TylF/MycF/NovP-related O-methyltransferase [Planctomycetota bacterium]